MTAMMNPVPNYLAHILMNPGVNARLRFRPRRTLFFVSNPATFKPPTKAPLAVTFVMGLKMSRFGKGKVTAAAVRRFIMDRFSGGSIVVQLGWWDCVREDSVKVTILNVGAAKDAAGKWRLVNNREFKVLADAMILRLIEEYGQWEIWVEYHRGTRRVDAKRAVWEEFKGRGGNV